MDYSHQHKKWPLNFCLVIPFKEFHAHLEHEIQRLNLKIIYKCSNYFILEQNINHLIWAQDIWHNCSTLPLSNIIELKKIDSLGYFFKTDAVSTYEKNQIKKLRLIPEKRIKYNPLKKFNFKYYIFTLLKDELSDYSSTIIISKNPTSLYPAGWHEFEEDKEFPPNRAYLKLWEVFQIHFPSHFFEVQNEKNMNALEIGASPGGWSWVLSLYFKKVFTFDRAPLNPKIASIKSIEHSTGDAFKIDPKDYPQFDYFFSDIICTPEKIYETILFWLDQRPNLKFVCTIKFKGECNFEILDKLLKIPDSKIMHLYHNKNEVTWIKF